MPSLYKEAEDFKHLYHAIECPVTNKQTNIRFNWKHEASEHDENLHQQEPLGPIRVLESYRENI